MEADGDIPDIVFGRRNIALPTSEADAGCTTLYLAFHGAGCARDRQPRRRLAYFHEPSSEDGKSTS